MIWGKKEIDKFYGFTWMEEWFCIFSFNLKRTKWVATVASYDGYSYLLIDNFLFRLKVGKSGYFE